MVLTNYQFSAPLSAPGLAQLVPQATKSNDLQLLADKAQSLSQGIICLNSSKFRAPGKHNYYSGLGVNLHLRIRYWLGTTTFSSA